MVFVSFFFFNPVPSHPKHTYVHVFLATPLGLFARFSSVDKEIFKKVENLVPSRHKDQIMTRHSITNLTPVYTD